MPRTVILFLNYYYYFRSREGGNYTQFGDDTTYDDVYLRRYEHFPEYYR